jgi:hypothetical protein
MKKLMIGAVLVISLLIGTTAYANGNGFFRNQRLEIINIGSPTSEVGHNLQGFGLIEPTTNGGNWGQITTETSCDLQISDVCDKALRTVYAGSEADHPLIDGRMASFSFTLKNKWGLVTNLKMRLLDGIANDDFVVYVKNKRGHWEQIYSYVSDPSTTEVWKVHDISLGPKHWFNKSLEVAVMATGDTWAQHATYGQLGIDWIELLGVSPIKPIVEDND